MNVSSCIISASDFEAFIMLGITASKRGAKRGMQLRVV